MNNLYKNYQRVRPARPLAWAVGAAGLILFAACSTTPSAAPAAAPAAATEQAATEQAATEQAAAEQAATEQPAADTSTVTSTDSSTDTGTVTSTGATTDTSTGATGTTTDTTTDTAAAGAGAPAVVPAANDAGGSRLQVPAGFALNTYFTGLRAPRLMTVGPDGALYVAERGSNAVVRLPDANNDGVADERQVVAQNLTGAHSVEWHEGALYVGTNGSVVRLQDQNGDGDFLDDGEQAVVTDNIPDGGVHSTRTAHFGPDGMLYVAAGSSSNIGVESDRRRAAILRFSADGSIPADNPFANDPEETRRPVWAEGLRNSVDFLFLPDGRLWADHNGSDMLGDDIPPEEIVIQVEKGKHYGWPYCYTPVEGVVPPGTQDVHDERVPFDQWLSDCSQSTPALFTDLAHQAPLGMALYNGTTFPAEYQGNLFVAYHGSWNSSVPRECKVERIVVQDGMPVSSESFVTGFMAATAIVRRRLGPPRRRVCGAHGELFVSDDQNGNIYRVVYTGS
ncbi:MAG: PQQ-dependent sugar dehydrogenase [Caldilineaceae bacterium]